MSMDDAKHLEERLRRFGPKEAEFLKKTVLSMDKAIRFNIKQWRNRFDDERVASILIGRITVKQVYGIPSRVPPREWEEEAWSLDLGVVNGRMHDAPQGVDVTYVDLIRCVAAYTNDLAGPKVWMTKPGALKAGHDYVAEPPESTEALSDTLASAGTALSAGASKAGKALAKAGARRGRLRHPAHH